MLITLNLEGNYFFITYYHLYIAIRQEISETNVVQIISLLESPDIRLAETWTQSFSLLTQRCLGYSDNLLWNSFLKSTLLCYYFVGDAFSRSYVIEFSMIHNILI